jgi:hypothetical protein
MLAYLRAIARPPAARLLHNGRCFARNVAILVLLARLGAQSDEM